MSSLGCGNKSNLLDFPNRSLYSISRPEQVRQQCWVTELSEMESRTYSSAGKYWFPGIDCVQDDSSKQANVPSRNVRVLPADGMCNSQTVYTTCEHHNSESPEREQSFSIGMMRIYELGERIFSQIDSWFYRLLRVKGISTS